MAFQVLGFHSSRIISSFPEPLQDGWEARQFRIGGAVAGPDQAEQRAGAERDASPPQLRHVRQNLVHVSGARRRPRTELQYLPVRAELDLPIFSWARPINELLPQAEGLRALKAGLHFRNLAH